MTGGEAGAAGADRSGRLLVLSARDVHAVLGYADCAAAMRDALTAHARGRAWQPLRTVLRPPGAAGLMALMPCHVPPGEPGFGVAPQPAGGEPGPGEPGPGEPAYGLKAICVTPGNPARGLDTHQGGVLISAAATGEPLALVNASALTEIRTAAVSAAATEALARPGPAVLAIVGAGVQARAHALCLAATRPLTRIRIASRDYGRACRLADEIEPAAGVPAAACRSVREALSGADVVVTATSSAAPVLERGWLADGAHINAVGACLPETRELDSRTVADAAVFADSRESAAREAGDLLLAQAEGAIGPGHVRAELGEVLAGTAPGRRGEAEITVFESLGLAIEDLAAAALAYRLAADTGAGVWVEF